jgi:hypothetical protein
MLLSVKKRAVLPHGGRLGEADTFAKIAGHLRALHPARFALEQLSASRENLIQGVLKV